MKTSDHPFLYDRRISADAVYRFLDRCIKQKIDLHAFTIYRGQELVARISLAPYDCIADKRQVYSASKSFTATGIGFAVQEGLLTVEDRVIDFFPDRLPAVVSENLAKMRVKHLLSMNTGHTFDTTLVLREQDPKGTDWIRLFLAQPVEKEPGTHFLYNTGASYLLSAILTKLTGQTLMDYLTPRLFDPLGIQHAYWRKSAEGVSWGGFDLHISCDDLAKLGLLYLNRGEWMGSQLLDPAWIDEATRKHSDNSAGATPDWQSGYGYQFWRCALGGCRADGAYGQYCLIRPDCGVVFSCLSMVDDMQQLLDLMQQLVDEIAVQGRRTAQDVELLIEAYHSSLAATGEALPEEAAKCCLMDPNPFGITAVLVSREEEVLTLHISDGEQTHLVRCGSDSWIENQLEAPRWQPALLDGAYGLRGSVRFAACYAVEEGHIVVICRALDCPHQLRITFGFTGGRLTIDCSGRDLYGVCDHHLTGTFQ